jgi:PRC-barrel domain
LKLLQDANVNVAEDPKFPELPFKFPVFPPLWLSALHFAAVCQLGLDVARENGLQNERLGDISEILLDKSGKVDGVVIGVGGFLGVGKHDIKVEMSKLKFVDEPIRTSSTAAPGSAATTGSANRPATATTTTKNKWYPDHAVLSGATKDSLKGMPEFKYD